MGLGWQQVETGVGFAASLPHSYWGTQAEGVPTSASISAFTSQQRAELVGLLLAFCKRSLEKTLTIDTPNYKQSVKYSPLSVSQKKDGTTSQWSEVISVTSIQGLEEKFTKTLFS